MNQTVLTTLSLDELRNLIQGCVSKSLDQFQPITINNDVEHYSRIESAKKLKISLPTLWKLTKDGTLPAYKIGKRVLYRKTDVENALRQMNFNPKY